MAPRPDQRRAPAPDGLAFSSPGYKAVRRLLANPATALGVAVIAVVAVMALGASSLAPRDPAFQDYGAVFAPPGAGHLLGADHLGRDTLSRLIYGARTSLGVGLFAQGIVVVIGVPVGAVAGFKGGRTDAAIMRFVDVMFAFPDLLLIILLRSIFGGGLPMVFLAIGLVEWTGLARLTRAQGLAIKNQEYVGASVALGAGPPAILLRHVAPNGMGPLVVAAVFGIPRAIFAEAALSYLGIGVEPPTPSWGSMVLDGYQAIFAFPHLILAPALAIAALTLSFTLLGDGLRDALDPREHPG